jgi:hypothetical protein
MGLNGSDVAKSVSEIVLADDNFASIIRAIKKGRGTLMNLSKFLIYLLSGNVAEVLVLMVGLAFKNEAGISVYPISPVAALWVSGGPLEGYWVAADVPYRSIRLPLDLQLSLWVSSLVRRGFHALAISGTI